MGYDAFVSYSHAADDRLAPRLQDGLQRLAKPWWRRRSLRVFRDQTGLSANPGLWSSIVEALDDSEWFVLLASPEAARSPWVERELSHWLNTRGPGRVLPVLTDGTWVWDAERNDFDATSTAVPAVLLGVFGEEPRHVDLSWARSEEQLDLRNGRFRDQVAELAAPMHGVAKDDLVGTDVREHRRTRRWATAGVASLVFAIAFAGVFGVTFAGARATSEQLATERGLRSELEDALADADRSREEARQASAEAKRQRAEAEANAALAAATAAEAEAAAAAADAARCPASRE